MTPLFVAPALALLSLAAWRDIATRTIPDALSLALVVLGLACRITEGLPALAWSLVVAALIFLLLLACHARGAIGGGDVKLLTALAVGLPPLGSYQLVVATALAGGALALIYLLLPHLLRHLPPARRAGSRANALRRIAAVEAWRIRRRGPMPYGVAIALGAALVLLQPPGG